MRSYNWSFKNYPYNYGLQCYKAATTENIQSLQYIVLQYNIKYEQKSIKAHKYQVAYILKYHSDTECNPYTV